MELIHNFVQNNALVISSSILIIAYIFIAWEKISKVTVAMIGACTNFDTWTACPVKGHDAVIDPHYFINFVDFNVIILLISMMIIVSIASKSGIFTWVANALLKKTKGHPVKILLVLGFLRHLLLHFLTMLQRLSLWCLLRFLLQNIWISTPFRI